MSKNIIRYQFPIKAEVSKVFDCISKPEGIQIWWAKSCSGKSDEGSILDLDLGPNYQWKARITKYKPNHLFELTLTKADNEWTGNKVGFELDERNEMTWLRFYHQAWKDQNEHYEITAFCWAMYLRLIKRYVEHGHQFRYEDRLEV